MFNNCIQLNLAGCQSRYEEYNVHFASRRLKSYLKIDQKLSANENLQRLAFEALQSETSAAYIYIYRPLLLDMVSRWVVFSEENRELSITVADRLGQIVGLYPEVGILCEYFLSKNHEYLSLVLESYATQPEKTVQQILLAYYRFLHHDCDKFVQFVTPKVLYSVLQHSFSDQSINYLAGLVLSNYLSMAEKASNSLTKKYLSGTQSIYATYEGDSRVDYRFLELNEAKRLSKHVALLRTYKEELSQPLSTKTENGIFTIFPPDLSSLVVSVYGVLVPRLGAWNSQDTILENDFVPTKESVSAIRSLAQSVQMSQPVMLMGKAGSGKTFLIHQLSKYTGSHDSMVKIHLGEQTDAKLLLGTYTSGEKPGTFEWRAGVLTTAVKEGRWVLIEDIDKAPTEVLSVLLTLLEKRELSIPSRGETIKARNGFQMISTIRIPDNGQKEEQVFQPELIGMRLWDTVQLSELEEDELLKILRHKYPVLCNLLPKFIDSYNSVRNVYSNPQFISTNKGIHPRAVTVRDLVKFCRRVQQLFQNNNIQNSEQLIPSKVYDSIFFEAADCFACAIGEVKALKPLIEAIGKALEISSSRVALYISKHVPPLEDNATSLVVGRAVIPKSVSKIQKRSVNDSSFARTNHALRLMEQIGVAVQMSEPVLLVGETGTGKTTVVQQVAKAVNQRLTVINVSQQTECGDLLGGYKPVNTKTIAVPLLEDFESLFPVTFSMKKNERFYKMLHKCFNRSQWKNVIKLLNEAFKLAKNLLSDDQEASIESKKKKRKLDSHSRTILLDRWVEFHQNTKKFEAQYSSIENSFVFNFVEGSLVKAVRNGEWLLLDEVNLASSDTLESISDLLSEPSSRSVLLSEKGQAEPVKAHPDFRIFACMNPATDVGKRDLPVGVRSRFTEIYVHSPDRDITDLLSIIDKYIGSYSVSDEWVGNDVAELYLEAKKLAESNKIVDGSNQRPHFSIRTLTRTLIYVRDIVGIYGLRRSLYEGFCMSFLTLLDEKSEGLLRPLIEKFTLGRLKNPKSVVSQIPSCPGSDYVQFKHYWMKKGSRDVLEQPNYIITPFVEKNMLNLVRATSGRRFPVLIQGPTSAGKTSMIKYLADITGHEFVRINNHEHTDLQEYLGTYVADETGKLSFREGVLVNALRKGHWIVLDELNLAPTDVLEALNRLLDDNRELFIPETQEVVHPHPDFMLFATQNPPGIYGGRKVLSRAFRNRFLELHFDDIPQDELEIILRERCKIAPSYAKKIVDAYRQLSVQRSATRLFEQKNSFATLRDLFRWALRGAVGYEELAANGYMLLAERCRTPEEKEVVKAVLEKVMKVKLDMNSYYNSLENAELHNLPSSVVWTKSMRRLAVLVLSCMQNNEPILLVGETGCGKTTVCQLIARYYGHRLVTINAHQNTETGDILGAQRPNRHRSDVQAELTEALLAILNTEKNQNISLDDLLSRYKVADKANFPSVAVEHIETLKDKLNILFEWCDGPLVQALQDGEYFLLDEISLADDSVLERLNSVLEPERSLLLAEKGGPDSFIQASEGFQFFATMNPGGDYGKKELSPALRNRFTEIWVPSMEDFDDVQMIVSSKLMPELSALTSPIVEFSKWFGEKFGSGPTNNGVISLRDILSWVQFVNSCASKLPDVNTALVQGAAMVFVDSLGTNNTAFLAENTEALAAQKYECIKTLSQLAGSDLYQQYQQQPSLEVSEETVKIGDFVLERETSASIPEFNLNAPTTAVNLMKVARAMQVEKPILLEGSPGVGKTSLISALADCTGNKLTRINLSEQTDLVDLFGSDAPGERTGEFVWRDAPFLRAMQLGEWVLLDEMNLASQSVLEGLNACLDHRGEAYVPELDKSFTKHKNFMVFAAQNPQYQGGGRKGLPKSFVNRFSVVYVDTLSPEDLFLIAKHLYPAVDAETCSLMIKIISVLEDEVSNKKLWGHSGSPWEFNLRDTLRWLKLLNSVSLSGRGVPADYLNLILTQRFRTPEDRSKVQNIFENALGKVEKRDNLLEFGPDYLQVNGEIALRSEFVTHTSSKGLVPLQCNFHVYESVLRCVNQNWPLILVGPSNSGKTDIIRYVAGMLGSKVVNFPMNSDIDSMDILGGYEQVDQNRKIAQLAEKLLFTLRQLLAVSVTSDKSSNEAISVALELFHYISSQSVGVSELGQVLDLVEKVSQYVESEEIFQILSELKKIEKILTSKPSITFEWFDGLLLKAMEEGSWLVLDNANLCSPSVLDRLNSLLETNGSLIINECSHEDGQPRIINPSPNFRLFLTVDPKFGELSRAMRNRSIEIYVNELSSRATLFDKTILGLSDKDELTQQREDQGSVWTTRFANSTLLSSFVSPTNSSVLPFAAVHDIIQLSEANVLESTSSIMPLKCFASFAQWEENIMNSSYFDEAQLVEKISSYGRFLSEIGILDKFCHISQDYNLLVEGIFEKPNSFSGNQPLMPVVNTYALKGISQKFPNMLTSESIYLFEICRLLLHFVGALEASAKRAQHVKLSDLSYLEICAAHDQGRNIKNPPKIPIFEVLTRLKNHILEQICQLELFSLPKAYESYLELCCIWLGAFDASKCSSYAKLRVYQELLESWQSKTHDCLRQTEAVSQIAQTFSNHLSLSTGRSMTIIWDEFRPSYPSSQRSWDEYSSMINVAVKFDEVIKKQFSDSYDLIEGLRNIFFDLRNAIVLDKVSDFNDVISKLENGIEDLNEISARFLTERKHFFREEFDALFRVMCQTGYHPGESINSIASYTSVSTEKLLRLKAGSYCYPPIFDTLWGKQGGTFTSSTASLFNNSMLEGIVRKVGSFRDISGSQVTQALDDSTKLLQSIVHASPSVLANKPKLFKNALEEWYVRVVALHIDIKSFTKVKDIRELVAASDDDWFKTIHDKYMLRAVETAESSDSLSSLGKAWILLAVGLMQLYVPSSPYDPAIHDYVLYDNFMVRKSLSEELSRSWELTRRVVSGDAPMLLESLLDTELDAHIPKKPRVFRPTEAVDPLFEEWSAFMKSTVGVEPVETLMDSLDRISTMSERQLDLFQQNSSQFLDRLSSNFGVYSDLNDIFRGYILSLKFGFDVFEQGRREDTKQLTLSPLWGVDAVILTDPERINSAFFELQKVFKEKAVESTDVERIGTFFLKLFSFHEKDTLLLETFDKTLQTLYYRWSMRRLRDEKEAQSHVGIYKFDDDEFDVESDFKRLFPDYESVLSVNDENSKSNQDSNTLEDIYFDIASAYISVFDGNKERDISKVITDGTKISELLLDFSVSYKNRGPDDKTLAAVLNQLAQEISTFESSRDNDAVDFYRGSSVYESRRAISVVEKLWNSVNNLLKQWPEHSTLKDLFRICAEFMEYPSSTPIARLLQKIEQICTVVTDWQKYASVAVSLEKSLKELTDLIISWRKLELQTWKSVFDNEDRVLNKSIGKWWFYLFETIVVSSSTENELSKESAGSVNGKLIISLNTFLSKCTYGEFRGRLSLLKAFANHCMLSNSSISSTSHSLFNVITFYEQFLPTFEKSLQQGRKKLEKEIAEVILLASWKDVNIDALKQSSHRSHNSLYKLVRKYRDLLSQSVSPIIEGGLHGLHKAKLEVETFTPLPSDASDAEGLLDVVSRVPSWETRPAPLKNLPLTVQNMSSHCSKIEAQEYPSILDFTEDLITEANRLRNETPKTYNKKEKKLLAALKIQKSKLLNDTLKELRRMGLKTSFREDIRKVQDTVTSILSDSVTFNGTSLQGCDVYFFQVLELLPRLRFAASDPAFDAPLPAIEKGMAINENLAYLLITSRNHMRKHAEDLELFAELRKSLEDIASSEHALLNRSLKMNYSVFSYLCKWMPSVLSFALETAKMLARGDVHNSQMKLLSEALDKLAEFNSLVKKSQVLDGKTHTVLKDFEAFCNQLSKSLLEDCCAETLFISKTVVDWLNEHRFSPETVNIDERSEDIESIDNAFRKVAISIMVSVQKLSDDKDNEISTEDDGWLIASHSKVIKLTKKLHSTKITSRMTEAIDLVLSQDYSRHHSKLVSAIVRFTMPLISRYYKLLISLTNRVKSHYYSLSHGTYTLGLMLFNLAKEGFCSPSPPDEETEDNNLQDGTGLGDGAGAQNNSKDVEEDEDLLEDAQKPNEDQNKDEDEEDDNDAVDMEGDMAGNLEDASGEDDDDDQDQDEENEELDEEIDDLNDDDPNAIDEKMWNEQAEDSSKEKQSDDAPQNSAEDDVKAAEGDRDESGSKDEDQKEQPNHDDEAADLDDNEAPSGSDSEDEDETGGQDDEVKNEEGADLETNVPEVETLELPDDMNLDSGDEGSEDNGSDVEGDEQDIEEEKLPQDEDEEINNKGAQEDEDEAQEASDVEMEDVDAEKEPEASDTNHDESEAEADAEGEGDAEGDVSDHELANEEVGEDDNSQEDENEVKEAGGEENAEDAEGLDGADDMMNIDNDLDSATQQKSGTQGEGADATNDEEEQNMGSFGNAQQEQKDSDDSQIQESSRQEAKESLKQLGDSLKEFHRRHQEIKEASNADENDNQDMKANERPDEFEHIDGANTDSNTQALGSANKDQITSIDEDKAIDDDVDEDEQDAEKDQEDSVNENPDIEESGNDEQMDVDQRPDQDSQGKSTGLLPDDALDTSEPAPITSPELFESESNDLDDIIDAIDQKVIIEEANAEPPRSLDEARMLWRKSEIETAELSAGLSEQLRLILEPTLATKLKGDYKTGKRLNMKRIIPYIASQFRKDKIWLRRTKPSKRQYQIMIAVDDSKSMSESKSVDLAFQSICLVSKALAQLESGGLSIVKFGQRTQEVHQFDQPFSNDAGPKVFQWFDFHETKTDVKKLVAESIRIFDRARASSSADLWQLQLIISDGVCEDHETIQRLVRRARDNKIMLVFVIVDGINSTESIMDMSQVKYVPDQYGGLQLRVEKYLDTFPFEFYVVVRDISELPEMLSVILRQYFSELASA